jgi:hypothetical protein
MIWKSPSGVGILVNRKVFSSEIAARIGDKNILDIIPEKFRARIHSTIPVFETNDPVHLLVADPAIKFYAACRENRIPPWVALIDLKSRPPANHFACQSDLLHVPNAVHLYRSTEHVADFFRATGLGPPPEIYTKPTLSDLDEQIRQIYSSDQSIYDSIRTAGQLVDKSALGTSPPFRQQFRAASTAAHRFARSGFVVTPPGILAAREATCRACPEWDASALNGTGRCRKCGCSTWAKLRMATERCPLGKWEPVLTDTKN